MLFVDALLIYLYGPICSRTIFFSFNIQEGFFTTHKDCELAPNRRLIRRFLIRYKLFLNLFLRF